MLLLSCCHRHPPVACAVEVQATSEWTLLGENDTIAAGMHVRIDLEKGQRWVKLLDPTPDATHASQSAQVLADGSQVMALASSDSTEIRQEVSQSDDPRTAVVDPPNQEEDPVHSMDFEMMHRTLSQLPDDEKRRIQLPDYVPKTNTKDRVVFEERMTQIWATRQKQLLELEQIDLPEVLKERVRQIQHYLHTDTVTRMQHIDLNRQHEIGVIDPDDIVSVLYDLEYHLTDIDMARDFHTLGGWPLLVSLLDGSLHLQNATNLYAEDVLMKMDRVQMLAAWCIGSAVKNQEEFHSFALERVNMSHSKRTTSALEIITEQTAAYNDLDYDFTETQKLNKFIYALGALLRGNRAAQTQFLAIRGPSHLGQLAARAVEINSRSSQRISVRLLMLAYDIISDTRLHQSSSAQVDEAIASAFANDRWCGAALHAINEFSLRSEATLKTLHVMVPYCESWSNDVVLEALNVVASAWNMQADDIDADIHRDRMALLKSIVNDFQK